MSVPAPGPLREPGFRVGDWLAGLTLGAISGLMLLSLGILALPLLAASILLIAWKGPRAIAGSGLLTGAGLIWSVLFARVAITCAIENATPGGGCDAGDIGAWVALSATLFALGLGVSAWLFARSLRRA